MPDGTDSIVTTNDLFPKLGILTDMDDLRGEDIVAAKWYYRYFCWTDVQITSIASDWYWFYRNPGDTTFQGLCFRLVQIFCFWHDIEMKCKSYFTYLALLIYVPYSLRKSYRCQSFFIKGFCKELLTYGLKNYKTILKFLHAAN